MTGISLATYLFVPFKKHIMSYAQIEETEVISSPSRLQLGLWGILLILVLSLSLFNYDSFQLGIYHDDASYVVLAQSIAFSDSYGLISAPGDPLPTRYPFGFPLLLAPFAWLFPQTPDMMKVLSLIATLINASLLFWGWPFLSQSKSYWYGLAVAFLFSLSPQVISQTRMVMSEPVFTTFALISLILCHWCLIRSQGRWLYTFLLGVSLTLTLFIRTVGLGLVLAILIRLVVPFRNNTIKNLTGVAVGGISFLLLVFLVTPVTPIDLVPHEYVNQLNNPKAWRQKPVEESKISRFFSATLEYAHQHLRVVILPIGGGESEKQFGQRFGIPDLPLIIGLGITSLVILGGLPFFKGKGVLPTVLIYEILYLGIILLWPWRLGRLLYPIQPFLIFQFLIGIYLIISRLEEYVPRQRLQLANLSLLLITISLSLLSIYRNSGVSDSHQFVRDFRVGTTWLKENTAPDVVIMAREPESIYLYSSRSTIDYLSPTAPESISVLEERLQLQGVDYILIAPHLMWHLDGLLVYDDFTLQEFLPMLQELSQQQKLNLVYESKADKVQIYHVN